MLQCGSRHCLFMPEVAEKEIEIHSLLNFSSTTIILSDSQWPGRLLPKT